MGSSSLIYLLRRIEYKLAVTSGTRPLHVHCIEIDT